MNSNRTSLFEEINPETAKDLDEFIKYLRNAYGSGLLDMRQNLSNHKEAENESMYSFLSRVINLYYRSWDQETSMDEIWTDKVSRTDIVHIFLKGLLNKDIKTNLRMR